MKDRAQQALYLLALAPVVETTAYKNSYGFRQQRSCADAMEQCFKALRSANTQWILEGDIKSCLTGFIVSVFTVSKPRLLSRGVRRA
jgi:RNA-directed DNA polymerase